MKNFDKKVICFKKDQSRNLQEIEIKVPTKMREIRDAIAVFVFLNGEVLNSSIKKELVQKFIYPDFYEKIEKFLQIGKTNEHHIIPSSRALYPLLKHKKKCIVNPKNPSLINKKNKAIHKFFHTLYANKLPENNLKSIIKIGQEKNLINKDNHLTNIIFSLEKFTDIQKEFYKNGTFTNISSKEKYKIVGMIKRGMKDFGIAKRILNKRDPYTTIIKNPQKYIYRQVLPYNYSFK